jgi:hypothetical protein
MTRYRNRWAVLPVLAVIGAAGHLFAGDIYDKGPIGSDAVVLPKPADVQSLAVLPLKITLKGVDDAWQLVVTANLGPSKLQDLTGDVKYTVADPKVATVTSSGRVIPLANGSTEITATYGDKTIKIPVTSTACDVNLPINFPNQIVPIFTKLGCNSGGCHGKASGQNGFKLSLLGFEPDVDFIALVKEGRGRRLTPFAPDNSLLLTKAAGVVAHGGGKRLDVGQDEYRLIRRWIAAGMPYGAPTDPTVTKISISPEQRVLTRQNKQQFAVYAHYSDGSIEDITRRAQYESNDPEIAIVDASALVRTLALSGEAGIMARYQGQVAVFRATVPVGGQTPQYQFTEQTIADKFTLKKWQELGLVPSDLCSDEQFIRRVSLATTGTLPTPKQVNDFVADKDASKRAKLVDRLLDSQEYSYYFATKWADILKVKRGGMQNRAQGTFGFHGWIKSAMQSDMPYDQFTREILTATGDETMNPPTVWYKSLTDPQQFVDDTTQVFLGLRMACAQCHHHPYEKYSQDDYWGIAAFFGRVGRKNILVAGGPQNQQNQLQVIYNKSSGGVANKRTGQNAVMKALDSEPAQPMGPDEDPRHKLVDWMVAPQNPFFAKAIVNRYWAHFYGRGLVDPLDDMRVTNPPSNPELLDALAKDFVDHKYSLKHLIRTICNSRTYQLSAVPNDFNKHDKQNYARFYPQRMGAEVLLDAVCQVTDSPTAFNGLPQDKFAPKRAIMLPDESYSSYFLDVFGRPQRISACECERVNEANLAQALHLLNSDEVQGKLSRGGARAEKLAADPRPDAEKVEELFQWAFARKPTQDQMNAALTHINKYAATKKVAYENIIWALINTKEFVFNQ